MTVENCINFLKAYKAKAEDPSAPDHVKKQSRQNYKNMVKHILNSKKFRDHPILTELTAKPVKKVKEVVEDGKKPKR